MLCHLYHDFFKLIPWIILLISPQPATTYPYMTYSPTRLLEVCFEGFGFLDIEIGGWFGPFMVSPFARTAEPLSIARQAYPFSTHVGL